MRKKLCALALALALTAGLATPAGAYYLIDDGYSIYPNEETYLFSEEYRFKLKDRSIYEVAADNWNFCGEFSEGLLVISEGITAPVNGVGFRPLIHNYIDKEGKLVDLNRNRYWMVHPFSEGLAAAWNSHLDGSIDPGGVAYIDHQGNEAVPYNSEWSHFRMGMIDFAGRFENGKALVMRSPRTNPEQGVGEPYNAADPNSWKTWDGIECAYIDTKGNYVSDWKVIKDEDSIIRLPIYDCNGVWIGHRMDPAAWAANAIPLDQLYKGKEAGSSAQDPSGTQAQPFYPEWHAPELPDYNSEAPSLFASTAKVTGFHLGDLDYGNATVTITNPGKVADAGVVAAVFVNVDNTNSAIDGDGVFFIPYELGPGESKGYDIRMRGIFNQDMFTAGGEHPYSEQLAGHVFSTIFTFADDADLLNFYDTIPYEQHWYPSHFVSEFQPICDGQPGTDWLKGVAGISRQPGALEFYDYYLPDGSTLNAAKADHYTYCVSH